MNKDTKKRLLEEMNKIANTIECWNCDRDIDATKDKEGRIFCPYCHYLNED